MGSHCSNEKGLSSGRPGTATGAVTGAVTCLHHHKGV